MTSRNPKTSLLTLAVLVALLCVLRNASAQLIRIFDGEVRTQSNLVDKYYPVLSSDDVNRTTLLTQTPIDCPILNQLRLDLDRKNLTDTQAEDILNNYALQCQTQFEKLKSFSIYLNFNQLTSIKFLSSTLRTMKNLDRLTISVAFNQINDAGIIDVQNLFHYNPLLQDLSINLAKNQITDLYPFKFAFRSLTKLTTLELFYQLNQISDVAFALTAFQSLPQLNLLYIDLGNNQITSFAPFAYAFDKCLKLNKLYLYFNENKVRSVQFVRIAFSKLTSLKILNLQLSQNQLVDVSPFETAFANNVALQGWTLSLNSNKISEGLNQLIDSIQFDIGDRMVFCQFGFQIQSNDFTKTQIQKLKKLEANLLNQYNTATCSGKKFDFQC